MEKSRLNVSYEIAGKNIVHLHPLERYQQQQQQQQQEAHRSEQAKKLRSGPNITINTQKLNLKKYLTSNIDDQLQSHCWKHFPSPNP